MKNFVLIGACGYIAPRHIDAIKRTENNLIACMDINIEDSKIKPSFPESKNFNDFEEFSNFILLNKENIDYVVICSPNFLHFEHCCWALKMGIDVICEKPIALKYSQLIELQEYEEKYSAKLWSILQLRLHDAIKELKQNYLKDAGQSSIVDLTYITPRNQAYLETWKGDIKKSGGILFNIGLHFFDMLLHVFGKPINIDVHHREAAYLSGKISFENLDVRWFLSILEKHSPKDPKLSDNLTYRSITYNGSELDFSKGFENLHYESYVNILNNKGNDINQNKPVIDLLETIYKKDIASSGVNYHPFLKKN